MKDKVISAFSLLIDSHMLQRIISCTESEAFRVLSKKWTLTETKLKAFLGILYARGRGGGIRSEKFETFVFVEYKMGSKLLFQHNESG